FAHGKPLPNALGETPPNGLSIRLIATGGQLHGADHAGLTLETDRITTDLWLHKLKRKRSPQRFPGMPILQRAAFHASKDDNAPIRLLFQEKGRGIDSRFATGGWDG